MARAPGVGLDHLDVEEMVRRSPTPEALARKAVRAIRRDQAMVVYGPEAQAFRLLRLLPAWITDPIGRFMAREGLKAVRPSAPPV